MSDYWVKDHKGMLVNLSRWKRVTAVYSHESNNVDIYHLLADDGAGTKFVTLIVGTRAECEAAMARLPIPIACDFSEGAL